MFERGYAKVRETVAKGSKYIRSCHNCRFFSKEKGDKEEVCQNSNVLKYDIIMTENTIYCLKWQPYEYVDKNSLFKRGGKKIVKIKEDKPKAGVSRCERIEW